MENKNRVKITIELNDRQQEMYEEWLGHIKALHGEVGQLTWKWSSCGIGPSISVYSDKTKTELDLTDIDSW